MKIFPITLIVLTCNEENNIAACLDSVPFVAEKLVIDSGSTDRTHEIAKKHGARVQHLDWLGFGKQRIAAEDFAQNEWILMLDADERLTPALQAECVNQLEEVMETCAAASFCRATWYMGAPLRWYTPYAADKIQRLYKRGQAHWAPKAVHENLQISGACYAFKNEVQHFSYSSITMHLAKSAKYIDLWAETAKDNNKRPRLFLYACLLPVYMCRDLFFRRGICDGWRGITAAAITAFTSILKRFRLYELYKQDESRSD